MIVGHNRVLFDTLGSAYQAVTEHCFWEAQNEALAKHWGKLRSGATVLDLGAGTGIGTVALARHLPPDARLIGVDITPSMVERANRRLAASPQPEGRVTFREGDAGDLRELPSGSVDAVVGNSFLYLVPDPAKVLAEAHRLLAPGGRVVFMEPFAEASFWRVALDGIHNAGLLLSEPATTGKLIASMVAWRCASGLIGRRPRHELEKLFRAAGFEYVRFVPTLGGLGQHVIATRR